jgi:hypothetical protein
MKFLGENNCSRNGIMKRRSRKGDRPYDNDD